MRSQTIPALQGELGVLFDLGNQISDTKPFPDSVLLVHEKSIYLFKDWGYRGGKSGAESVFPENSGVSFNLIAATRGRDEAQQETPWRAASEAREFETVPELYEIQSPVSTAELLSIAKEDHFLSVSLAMTTGGLNPQISSVEHFPAWWQDPSRDFFKHRGLTAKHNSGTYFCNSMAQFVLDIVARPQNFESYDLPDSDGYSDNSLTYETKLDGFVMNFKITQNSGESPAEFIFALRRLQYFLFEGLDDYIDQQVSSSFADHFAEFLDLGRFRALKHLLEGNYVEPFFNDDDRIRSTSKWWFTPMALRIQVEKQEIDPSFGTFNPDSTKNFEILELRENWLRTNFANVNETAYLKRLVDQAQRFSS